MKAIWKYELEIADRQEVYIPQGAEILAVDNHKGGLCVWALVDKDSTIQEPIAFRIVGTGNPFEDTGLKYLDSVVIDPFVWHVFVEEDS